MSHPPEQPNILLVLTDDHAQWAAGCYGNSELRTPTMDHLARTGVRMQNAFTPTPVCSPARACLLTGRLASQHGMHDYLSEESTRQAPWLQHETLLQQHLNAAGYRTGMVGKWHLGPAEEPAAGFDYWYSHQAPTPEAQAYESPWPKSTTRAQGYNPHAITDHAIEFLRSCEADRPFFLHVGYFATHSPWWGHPERLVEPYRQAAFTDIPDDPTYPFGRLAAESLYPTRADPREALAQYYASVTEIDEQLGRLLDELHAQGSHESTLVVYTSDHGLNTGHHGIWGKGNGTQPYNMVEESIRVPLLLSQPGSLLGRQVRAEPVTHLDTHATLLDHAGITIDCQTAQQRRFPGRSFRDAALGKSLPDWPQLTFGEYGDLRMVRDRRFKLIRRDRNEGDQLFDLDTDPRESTNLIHDPDQHERVAQLDTALEQYFSTYEEPEHTGRRVLQLAPHNHDEAWRTDPSDHRIEERPAWLQKIIDNGGHN